MDNSLQSKVSVKRFFQRSVRIDKDLGDYSALDGYVAQESSLSIIKLMCKTILEGHNCSFTWTGQYGSGKSSLALVLSSLLSEDKKIQDKAKSLLGVQEDDEISKVFLQGDTKWHSINLVGSNSSLKDALSIKLEEHFNQEIADPIKSIEELCLDNKNAVLLLIDELGAFLANAIKNNSIIFLQELAEVASRSNGSFVIVGILHQSFESYIANFSREIREEWAKVQGRFENYVLAPSLFESLRLVGLSLDKNDYQGNFERIDDLVNVLYSKTPQFIDSIKKSFENCLPLHPLTAILLCSLAKKEYGQNERSLFGFLTSFEPNSFQSFLESEDVQSKALYTAAHLFDYLKANQSLMIAVSKDAHKWEEANDILNRVEINSSTLEIELLKTIAMIEIYGKVHGVSANFDLLFTSFNVDAEELNEALNNLIKKKAILKRSFDLSYGLFAGSDFDFDAEFDKAYAQTEFNIANLKAELNDVERVIGKRHYIQTGTLRWFEVKAIEEELLDKELSSIVTLNDKVGTIFIVYPQSIDSVDNLKVKLKTITQKNAIFCINENFTVLEKLCRNLDALHMILKSPALEGDLIARNEINARIKATSEELKGFFNDSFYGNVLFYDGQELPCKDLNDVSILVSKICDEVFCEALPLQNELINRNKLSSNIASARRILLTRMCENLKEERLGIEKTPAEFCIYNAIFKQNGIHHQKESSNEFFFDTTSEQVNQKYLNFFAKTLDFIKNKKELLTTDIFDFWSKPPFGIKKGPQPVLLMALLLSSRNNLACYVNKLFATSLDKSFVDEFNVSPERISIKWFDRDGVDQKVLLNVAHALQKFSKNQFDLTPLAVARQLVHFVLTLPLLTQKTNNLNKVTVRLKVAAINANDPLDLLFNEVLKLFPELNNDSKSFEASLAELRDFYDRQIESLKDLLFSTLKHNPEDAISGLVERANNIKATTGNNKLEQFVIKISQLDISEKTAIEGIISICAEKPKAQWTDKEINLTQALIPELSLEFRRAECFAKLHNREELRCVFGLSLGATANQDLLKVVDISPQEKELAQNLASKILVELQKTTSKDLSYAVLAELGVMLGKEELKE